MCGIAGIIGRVDDSNRAALRRMSNAIAHRGPDAEGFWRSAPDQEGRGVLLAHRRLSILDLSPAGAQPMVDPTTGDAVVFNGEIYNYVLLRERLTAAGQRFDSTGDTAVMLRALAVEGVRAIPTFRGMFAFAFFQASSRNVVLARDPLGIKPLYVARNRDADGNWAVLFASEVRALLASGLLGTPRLNPRAVASVVWNGFVTGPDTAVDGIECLSPGEFRVFDEAGSQVSAQLFWTIQRQGSAAPMGEREVACALEQSVHLHLASDVPLGVFLSGGIDSSAVANLARRSSAQPVHTFTLAFEEPEWNEGVSARRVAEAIGTEHTEVMLTESNFVSRLESALDSLDQPTFDGLNSYYMSCAVREAGFKVALVGTGGDELFGGYSSFRHLTRLHALACRTQLVPRALRVAAARLCAAAAAHGGGAVPPQTRWAKLPGMVVREDELPALYQLAYALFLPEFQEQLLASAVDRALVDGLSNAMRDRIVAETEGRSPLSAISVMEQRLFLGERLLRDSDAASMAASIELRLPLVDQVLFEHVDRLPDALRYEPLGKKSLLRRLGLVGLEPKLFDRPKRGFVLPFDRWIGRSLGQVMDQTLRDPVMVESVGLAPDSVRRLWKAFQERAPGMYWSRIWAVYVLIRWCHRHRVLL